MLNSQETTLFRDNDSNSVAHLSLPTTASLHRHALGQITRLIDIGTLQNGNMVGEQL